MDFCHNCKFYLYDTNRLPCCTCRLIDKGSINHFTAKTAPEQPTIPPMPPVNPPKEEINQPALIDVMAEVFGVEAVKNFCFLNVFKCLWKSKKETAKKDVENAVWYLNEYIKLGDEDK